MKSDDHDEDGFPIPCQENEGTVYVDAFVFDGALFEVAWVCEWEPDLAAYVWRSLGPVHPPKRED